MKQFLEKEKELFSIIDRLETDILRFVEPVNSVQQKERFFSELRKGNEFNPVFSYMPKNVFFTYLNLSPEYAEMLKKMEGLHFEETGMEKLLKKKKNETIKKIELVRAIGNLSFPAKSVSYYGKPDSRLVKHAFELIEKKQSGKEKKMYSGERTAAFLQNKLVRKKIDWSIVLEENMSANAVVLGSEKKVKIRSNAFYSKKDMQRLFLHEIETHVFRHINALNQPFRLFLEGVSAEWLETEEGLAVINEIIFGKSDYARIREYAGRVIAIHFAGKNSFFETFKHLRNYFDEEKAYQLTQRAKRGCKTTEAGAFTKDYYYLKGAIKIKEFIESNGDLKELYYGKISLSELESLKEAPVLKKPVFLPDYKKADLKKLEKLPI